MIVNDRDEVDALPVTKANVGLPKSSWASNRARVCIDYLVRSGRIFFGQVCLCRRPTSEASGISDENNYDANERHLFDKKKTEETKQKQNTDS